MLQGKTNSYLQKSVKGENKLKIRVNTYTLLNIKQITSKNYGMPQGTLLNACNDLYGNRI